MEIERHSIWTHQHRVVCLFVLHLITSPWDGLKKFRDDRLTFVYVFPFGQNNVWECGSELYPLFLFLCQGAVICLQLPVWPPPSSSSSSWSANQLLSNPVCCLYSSWAQDDDDDDDDLRSLTTATKASTLSGTFFLTLVFKQHQRHIALIV